MFNFIKDFIDQRKRLQIIKKQITADFESVISTKNFIMNVNNNSDYRVNLESNFEKMCDVIVSYKEDPEIVQLVCKCAKEMGDRLLLHNNTPRYENHKRRMIYAELRDLFSKLLDELMHYQQAIESK
ncbi:hypothetical protein ACIQZG_22150 [Lysinibacillus sp. NPDC096418]|uniref:hypothetical protein n=1 Tax=Lysinibacillus sp. NPDC096418 TaxID=3364138 RepID=UPI003808CB66